MTKTMQEIVAGTKWRVCTWAENAYLHNDEFAHDATLLITGDFASRDEKIAYAQALADRLNGGAE